MTNPHDSWTTAHDLALIYVALAYGADYDFSDAELDAVTARLDTWRDDLELGDTQEVLMEALAVFMEKDAGEETVRAMRALAGQLTDAQRARALEDVVRIAEADGVLLNSERGLIHLLADIWDLKAAGEGLLATSDAEREGRPVWSLMHDLCLIYVVVAHSSDNDLDPRELDAIIARLQGWEPEVGEKEVRTVVREVLQVYAQQPDAEALEQSIRAIGEAMPVMQRLAVLDDLLFIAESDGELNVHEETMLASLARQWDVGVRFNGIKRAEV